MPNDITIVDSNQGSGNGGTIGLPMPSTIQDGDVILVVLSDYGSYAPGYPSGFTVLWDSGSIAGPNYPGRQTVYAKTATAADASTTQTFSVSSSYWTTAWCVLRGVSANGQMVHATSPSTGAYSININGTITTTKPSLILFLSSVECGTTLSSNDPYIAYSDLGTPTPLETVTYTYSATDLEYFNQTTPGDTGASTSQLSTRNSSYMSTYIYTVLALPALHWSPEAVTNLAPDQTNRDSRQDQVFSWQYDPNNPDPQVSAQIRYQELNSGRGWTYLNSVTTSQPQITVPAGTFELGKEYEWQVVTANTVGSGPWSDSATFLAGSSYWDTQSEVSSASTSTTIDISNLTRGSNYVWEVRAADADGYGPWSNAGQFTVPGIGKSGADSQPVSIQEVSYLDKSGGASSSEDAPTTPTITFPTSSDTLYTFSQTITWNAAIDPQGDAITYSIDFSTDGGLTWDIIGAGISGTSFDYDFSTYSVGSNNVMRIRASDGKLYSPYDYSGPFVMASNAPPNAPGSLVPNNQTFYEGDTVDFSWTYSDPNSDAEQDAILTYGIGTASNDIDVGAVTSYSMATGYSDTYTGTYQGAGTYVWKVKVEDARGAWSNYSSTASFEVIGVRGTSDTGSISATESSSILAFVASNDSPAISVNEGTLTFKTISAGDSLALSLNETHSGFHQIVAQDSGVLSITEVPNVFINYTGHDSGIISVAEQSNVTVYGTFAVTSSDSGTFTVTENQQFGPVGVPNADSSKISAGESLAIHAAFSTTDSINLSVSEQSSIEKFGLFFHSAGEDLNIAVSDSPKNLTRGKEASEGISLSVTEQAEVSPTDRLPTYVWDGSNWIPGVSYVWDGTEWRPTAKKVWNGIDWV